MRLLIDQNLATRVAARLRDAGHDVVHVAERGMAAADDDEVLGLAVAEARVLVSEDTDFGALLSRSGSAVPSLVLIRSAERLTTEARATLLAATLPRVESELEAGAIVVLGRSRVRVRPLPLPPRG